MELQTTSSASNCWLIFNCRQSPVTMLLNASIVAKITSITISTDSPTLKMIATGAYKSKVEDGRKVVIQAFDCCDGENRKIFMSLQLDNLPAEVAGAYSYRDPRFVKGRYRLSFVRVVVARSRVTLKLQSSN